MIKLIDLYLLKRFIGRMLFLIIGVSAIILLTNFVEMIDNFIDANMSNREIFNYYLLTIPMIVSYAIPMSITISSVLSMVTYIKNNELIAIRSLGVNYFRLTIGIIFVSILISIGHFYFENNVVSNSNRLKNQITRKYNLSKKRIKLTNFIEDTGKQQSIVIMNYNNKKQTAINVTINEIDSYNDLIKRIDTKEMKWNQKTGYWIVSELNLRNWKNNQLIFKKIVKDTSIFLKNIDPIYLTSEFIEPEQMNYFELKKFINIKKENSGNTTKWEVNLHHKIAYSFSSLILAICSIIASIGLKNSNILLSKTSIPFYLGATSLLIVVVVMIDFITQIQSHLFQHQYEGLLKKTKLKGRR